MTDINEVMDRLSARVDAWSLNTDAARISVRLGDLKALLSYTKQCREALEPFAKAGELFKWKLPGSGTTMAIYTPAAGSEYAINSDHLRLARQALSTQPGERE